ncbi:MAG: hypothetical protein M3R10_08335, partial [Verrucomicrobiota bacterium]|nr:hypothetical protein [Verrucomicrobiota bacterium]
MKKPPGLTWLLLRWLLIIGSIAAAIVGLASCGRKNQLTRFQTVQLVEGDRSVGMRLLGIAVDQRRRDVYAIVGKPENKDRAGQFVIVWKGNDGETYGTTFASGDKGTTLCEATKRGEVRTLYRFSELDARERNTT